MNPARWESAKRLFHDALERPPAERDAFVREAAAGDAELRDEVVALLTAHTKADAAFGEVVRPSSNVSEATPALPQGTRLGPYEIDRLIGAGGMGEVYRARDTRLDRTVAIKVLPAYVSADPQARARFEREARAVSSLNHPHICTLHDIGHHEGIDFLVMEHLDGETLAARLTKGPLPIAQSLQIGIQIASALDRAHRAGIVHRDLKPGNIFLVRGGGSAPPTAKLLDFGLAKTTAPIGATAATGVALTSGLTTPGMIVGTVQYMAPEQVEGKAADARSDIWAIGAVLYEMTAGRRPFEGESPAAVIGAILTTDPPPISARPPLSPTFAHIVGRCLEKDPDERWQTAADLMRELRWAGASTSTGVASQPSARFAQRLSWVVALAGVTAAVVMGIALARSPRGAIASAPVMRFEITPPPNATFALNAPATVPTTQLALSPDGRWLAFVAERAGSDAMLWIRPIDGTAAQALPGTEDGSYPFWEPDSHAIGFFAQGKLKRIDVPGGAPQTLCDALDPRGGSWSRDNVILFGLSQTGLWRVSSSGGEQALVTKPLANETGHRWPSFLPDGRHFLFFALTRTQADSSINVGSIDGPERTRLFGSWSSASYASSGHLLSLAKGMLTAQPFDPVKRTLSGEPTTIAQDVAGASVNYAAFSTSDTELLAFAAPASLMQLAWFGRDGKVIARLGPPRDYADVQLSPDDRRALLTRLDPTTGGGNIWTVDVANGASSPLTFDPSVSAQPVWSPDGRDVVFRSNRERPAPLFRRLASGAGGDDLLLRSEKTLADAGNLFPSDWSSEGRFILFHTAFPGTGYDVWMLPMTGDRTPRPFVRGRGDDMHARFSHDGRFVAYTSTESGHAQIYVQPFPAANGRWQLSNEGGSEPRWRADGRELFFIGADRRLMAVPIAAGASFEHGAPVPLFTTRVSNFANPFRTSYAVSRDGQRFLISGLADDSAVSSITAMANWPTLLKK